MRAVLIMVNWLASFMGLCVDTERTALWICLVLYGWFLGATMMLNYADRRGWMDELMKRFEMD